MSRPRSSPKSLASGPKKRAKRIPQASSIILASLSPRRKELLARIVLRFRVVPSGVDEARFREKDPEDFALKAALAKAISVGRAHPSALIIAADTVVVLGESIFGKPVNRDEARQMLSALSERTHRVITVVILYRHRDGRTLSGQETSWVTFKRLGAGDIDAYLDSVDYRDKAGAYAIQELGDKLVAQLQGDYDNVVGFPVALVERLLKKCTAENAASGPWQARVLRLSRPKQKAPPHRKI